MGGMDYVTPNAITGSVQNVPRVLGREAGSGSRSKGSDRTVGVTGLEKVSGAQGAAVSVWATLPQQWLPVGGEVQATGG